jgi:hypothetical protein
VKRRREFAAPAMKLGFEERIRGFSVVPMIPVPIRILVLPLDQLRRYRYVRSSSASPLSFAAARNNDLFRLILTHDTIDDEPAIALNRRRPDRDGAGCCLKVPP